MPLRRTIIALTLLSAGATAPSEAADLTFLLSLKLETAEADARRDYDRRGLRLLAVRGYTLEIPAAPMPEALNLPYCIIEGTSDGILDGPAGQVVINARNYAGVYNTMMLELASEDRRFDKTIRPGEACR